MVMILQFCIFQATVTTHTTSYCQSAYGGAWTTPSNCASKSGKDTCQVKFYVNFHNTH